MTTWQQITVYLTSTQASLSPAEASSSHHCEYIFQNVWTMPGEGHLCVPHRMLNFKIVEKSHSPVTT